MPFNLLLQHQQPQKNFKQRGPFIQLIYLFYFYETYQTRQFLFLLHRDYQNLHRQEFFNHRKPHPQVHHLRQRLRIFIINQPLLILLLLHRILLSFFNLFNLNIKRQFFINLQLNNQDQQKISSLINLLFILNCQQLFLILFIFSTYFKPQFLPQFILLQFFLVYQVPDLFQLFQFSFQRPSFLLLQVLFVFFLFL